MIPFRVLVRLKIFQLAGVAALAIPINTFLVEVGHHLFLRCRKECSTAAEMPYSSTKLLWLCFVALRYTSLRTNRCMELGIPFELPVQLLLSGKCHLQCNYFTEGTRPAKH